MIAPSTPAPRWPQTLLQGLLVAMLAGGCSTSDGEAAATWRVAPDEVLNSSTTTFTALVSRLACNSGVTGEVIDPVIEQSDEDVVITFTVSPDDLEAADCPGNDEVAYEVQLPQALGQRSVIDGTCALAEESDTMTCQPDGVRFSP